MCETCESVTTYDIHLPNQYMNCLSYINKLLESGKFKFVAGTPVDKVQDEQGRWSDDIISTEISCIACGDYFLCVVNTYHGSGGSFERRKASKMTSFKLSIINKLAKIRRC